MLVVACLLGWQLPSLGPSSGSFLGLATELFLSAWDSYESYELLGWPEVQAWSWTSVEFGDFCE